MTTYSATAMPAASTTSRIVGPPRSSRWPRDDLSLIVKTPTLIRRSWSWESLIGSVLTPGLPSTGRRLVVAAAELAALAAGLVDQADLVDRHLAIDRLAHIVDGQRG